MRERDPEVEDVAMRIENVSTWIRGFCGREILEVAKPEVEAAGAGDWYMETGVGLRNIELDSIVGHEVKPSGGFIITGIATFHDPNFETPVEASDVGIQCTLANYRDLVQ